MTFSLVIFEHTNPTEAHPLLATRDPNIIALVKRMLVERLGDEPTGNIRPLKRPQRDVKREKTEALKGRPDAWRGEGEDDQ